MGQILYQCCTTEIYLHIWTSDNPRCPVWLTIQKWHFIWCDFFDLQLVLRITTDIQNREARHPFSCLCPSLLLYTKPRTQWASEEDIIRGAVPMGREEGGDLMSFKFFITVSLKMPKIAHFPFIFPGLVLKYHLNVLIQKCWMKTPPQHAALHKTL